MDPFQYNDLPQVPTFADEAPFMLWPSGNFGNLHGARYHDGRAQEAFFEEFAHSKLLNMQTMHRFLQGPSPLTFGVLDAKLNKAHFTQGYDQPWLSAESHAYSPRNASPTRTSISGTSSQSSRNELQSPLPLQASGDDAPDWYQPGLSYPSPKLSQDGKYENELPTTGGNINLRVVELHHDNDEPEATTDDQDHAETNPKYDHEQESNYENVEIVIDRCKNYSESDISNNIRDAESVQPMTPGDGSDSEYNPLSRSRKNKKRSLPTNRSSRKSTRRRGDQKRSLVSTHLTVPRVDKKGRVAKATSCAIVKGSDVLRPFPCPLAVYGCRSDFISKNEWKRHIATKHVKLAFWRCDLCQENVDANDDQTVYHNDFNRKDLFAQHLRRMHKADEKVVLGPERYNIKKHPVNEENLAAHQQRCHIVLRAAPQQSACLFCEDVFNGPNSWEQRIEHVGRHLEKDGKNISLDPTRWREDKVLEQWLEAEGLVARDHNGGWKIGNGTPRRDSVIGSNSNY
jgi:hypothetical protein